MDPSRGSQRLAQIVAESAQATVAETIGVSQQTVSDWLRDKMKPRGKNMLRLSERLGINPAAWFEKPQPPDPHTPRTKKPSPSKPSRRKPAAKKRRAKGPGPKRAQVEQPQDEQPQDEQPTAERAA